MSRITKHTYESAFADRLITGPHRFFRDDSALYRCLHDEMATFPVTIYAQCVGPRIAERMTRHREVERVDERDFQRFYSRLDFTHIEIGKTLRIPKIMMKAPPWGELREWLEDALVGEVSAFVNVRETRLSFSDEGDYMLARLAWG